MRFHFPNGRKRTVAIVVPSKAHVEALANRIGMATESFEQLCSNAKVCQAVLDSLNASGSQAGAILNANYTSSLLNPPSRSL